MSLDAGCFKYYLSQRLCRPMPRTLRSVAVMKKKLGSAFAQVCRLYGK